MLKKILWNYKINWKSRNCCTVRGRIEHTWCTNNYSRVPALIFWVNLHRFWWDSHTIELEDEQNRTSNSRGISKKLVKFKCLVGCLKKIWRYTNAHENCYREFDGWPIFLYLAYFTRYLLKCEFFRVPKHFYARKMGGTGKLRRSTILHLRNFVYFLEKRGFW